MNKNLVVIAGPTAVGKTEVTIKLAQYFDVPVINADSRQMYIGMKIGTAAPTVRDMKGIKHYFVGDRPVTRAISAGIYEEEVLEILDHEFQNSNIAILSGGSGLYIKAVTEGFDEIPDVDYEIRNQLNDELKRRGLDELTKELETKDREYAAIVDRNNPHRVIRALEVIRSSGKPYSSFHKNERNTRSFQTIKIGLTIERAELYERIEKRVDNMIHSGLFEEAEHLKEHKDLDPLKTVGYQEVFGFMDGKYDYEEAVRLLKRNTRRYAKRQLTWFTKDPEFKWFHPNQLKSIIGYIESKKV